MPISIDRYVDITSGVIGASAVAQRELVGLRFTNDPHAPIGAILSFNSATEVAAYFGSSSPEAVFAAQYFGYISPAPASQAQTLRFAAWANVSRPPTIYGASGTYTIDDFNGIDDGALNLSLGGESFILTGIDLTSAANLAAVATAVQTAIRAHTAGGTQWTGATVSFGGVNSQFNLIGGTDPTAEISVAVAGTGSDLGLLMGWLDSGTIFSPGSVPQSPLQALQAAEQITDSFGSFSYEPPVSVELALAVAQYNASLNVKYMYLQSVAKDTAEDYYAVLQGLASVGLVLDAKDGEYKVALPQAIMAATNYDRRNATVNYMFRQGSYSSPYDVSTDLEANEFDAMRVNYYGETSSAGQRLAFFQRGLLMGGATAPLDMNVHANEQWLKAYLTAKLMDLQLSLGKIPANGEGAGYVLAQVVGAANQAKFNGTISVGKTLTVAQQIAITQLTGDTDAWREVRTNGFWSDVTIVERTGPSNVTEYVAQYTLAYAKNDVVRKIEGSHNLV